MTDGVPDIPKKRADRVDEVRAMLRAEAEKPERSDCSLRFEDVLSSDLVGEALPLLMLVGCSDVVRVAAAYEVVHSLNQSETWSVALVALLAFVASVPDRPILLPKGGPTSGETG